MAHYTSVLNSSSVSLLSGLVVTPGVNRVSGSFTCIRTSRFGLCHIKSFPSVTESVVVFIGPSVVDVGEEASVQIRITDSEPVNGGVFFWTECPCERLHGNHGKRPRTAWKRIFGRPPSLFSSPVFLPLVVFISLRPSVARPFCPPLFILSFCFL